MPLRVVADTGPLNYLVQIDAIEVLPKLFDQIVIPNSVLAELVHPHAPETLSRMTNTRVAFVFHRC